jgi:hypothetical protein
MVGRWMNESVQDRRSLFLLISLLFYLVFSAFVTRDRAGELALALAMYVILVAATLGSSAKRVWRWPAILLVACSMVVMFASILNPAHALQIANWLLLAVFFGFVSARLFSYLGRPGSITSGRLYASVSLYFMLGTLYYTIFNLIETVYPGSFVEAVSRPPEIHHSSLLYLSLVTLTTLGYGDVLPISPPARMLTALEAATGVLYVAITVARLVAAYQGTSTERT